MGCVWGCVCRGVSWGALGPRSPGVTKGAPKRRKGKGKKEREGKEKRGKKEGVQKREKLEYDENCAIQGGRGVPIFYRNRAPDFFSGPLTKSCILHFFLYF